MAISGVYYARIEANLSGDLPESFSRKNTLELVFPRGLPRRKESEESR